MAIRYLTPPDRGGERPRWPSPQRGPVSLALAAINAADPDRELRRRIAERIEADIALLDALDGDCDSEDENEHGGDVQDEPHDADEGERDKAIEWTGHGTYVFSQGGHFV